MNTVLALLHKEFSLFLRDKTAVVMTFVVPFVLIAIMGSIFGGMGGDNGGPAAKAKLAVYLENPQDETAQTLLDALRSEESLEILTGATSESGEQTPFTEADLRTGIEEHKFNFGLVVPSDFVKTDGIGLKLRLIYNPRNDIETQMVNGLTQKAIFTKLPQLLAGQVDDYSKQQMGEQRYTQFLDGMAAAVSLAMDADYDEVRSHMGMRGLAQSWLEQGPAADGESTGDGTSAGGSIFDDLLEVEKDQVFGKEVKNSQLTRIVGGYAVMFLLFAVTGSSTSLFEERNEGIFARLLSLPVKRHHILWSKFLYNALLGIVQVLTLFVFASLLFKVEIFQNFLTLFVMAVAVSLSCTAFGMFLASVAKTPAQANGLGTLLILTMSSLGGAWWPVEFMQLELFGVKILQVLAHFTIVYWGVEGFLAALWENATLVQALPTLGMILLFAVVLNALSLWRFKKGDLFR